MIGRLSQPFLCEQEKKNIKGRVFHFVVSETMPSFSGYVVFPKGCRASFATYRLGTCVRKAVVRAVKFCGNRKRGVEHIRVTSTIDRDHNYTYCTQDIFARFLGFSRRIQDGATNGHRRTLRNQEKNQA